MVTNDWEQVIICLNTQRNLRCVGSPMIPWIFSGKPATMDSFLVAWYTLDAMVCRCFDGEDGVLGDVLSHLY